MKHIQSLLCRLFLGIGFILLLSDTSFATDPPTDPNARPLSDFLTENGTFQNSIDYSGQLNAEGFSLSVQEDGTPVFMNSNGNENWTLESIIPGANAEVTSIVADGDYIYVGGEFTSIAGVSATRIARYNKLTRKWSSFGDGISRGVETITIAGDFLYVGGAFTIAGNKTANGIARYDMSEDKGNSSWEILGEGLANNDDTSIRVNALIVSDNVLFVGGSFESAGGKMADNIARYDLEANKGNSSWNTIGGGVNGPVYSLAISENYLFVGGLFDYPSPFGIEDFVRYDLSEDNGNSSWSYPSKRDFGVVNDFVVDGDILYIAAKYTPDPNRSETYPLLARLNIETRESTILWEGDEDGTINEIILMEDYIYLGGKFRKKGDGSTTNLARYNIIDGNGLESLESLDNEFSNSILTLHSSDDILYVGGIFESIGDIPANHLAYNNFSNGKNNWKAFGGEGLNGAVRSLVVHEDVLYLGGFFTSVGGILASGVAGYNLNTKKWTAFGDGINGQVLCIAVIDDFLYAGGYFDKAGDKSVTHIARYNLKEDAGNSSWRGLAHVDRPIFGDNIGNPGINKMIVDGNTLIVGGRFSTLDGNSYSMNGSAKNSIARFDTNTETWTGFGDGIEGDYDDYDYYPAGIADANVDGIALVGDYLYVHGYSVDYAGNKEINSIARYNLKEDNGNASWYAVPGLDLRFIYEILVNEKELIIATSASDYGLSGGRIGRYNTIDKSWTLFERILDGSIYSLVLLDNYLIVGGSFKHAGNIEMNHITKLNLISGEWESLGDGLDKSVFAFTTSGNDLYVGGSFTEAGGKPASYLARWHEEDVLPEQIELISPENKETNISIYPTLDWLHDPYVDGYIFMVSITDDFSNPIIHHKNVSSSSYEITVDLEYGETYYWRVRGSNEFGNGAWSDTWSFTTKSAPTPDEVSLLFPANNSEDIPVRPELAWQSTEEAESYELVLSENSDLTSPLLHQSDIGETTFQISQDLHFDNTYYWHVRGINEHGEGDWSETWSFTTVALPDQVTLSSPANDSENVSLQPELTWQTAEESESYEFIISANADFSDLFLQQADLMKTSVQITEDLDYATSYYWHVRGVNEHGNGPWSETWTFTTILPPMPDQVALLTPANNSPDIPLQPALSWEPAEETQSYDLILSAESDLSNPVLQQTGLQETTFQLSEDLDYSQTYYWQVRGVNMYGEGSWSEVWSFTTIAPTEIALEPNWPNPFSNATSGTTIRFRLPEESNVHLDIYDISGRRVAVLVNKTMPAGEHDVLFNGSGLADGVYFYRLVTGTTSMTRKMLLLK